MERLGHAKSFGELVVYRKARSVAQELFDLTKGFPREETYSLTDQLRRSSRSIGAQIAEAWGKRRYERHFVNKLTDADAEQLETQHWIQVAASCGYLDASYAAKLTNDLNEIGRMLHSMVEKVSSFCSIIRESEGAYTQSPFDHQSLITDH